MQLRCSGEESRTACGSMLAVREQLRPNLVMSASVPKDEEDEGGKKKTEASRATRGS